MRTHAVQMDSDTVLNQYTTTNIKPRPESYREDLNNSRGMTMPDAQRFFANVAAGAESGEDFSTRWFLSGSDLKTIGITTIVPVDLNAILYKFESNMIFFYNALNVTPASDYAGAHLKRKQAMDKYLWNSSASQWYDYCITNKSQIIRSYPSNWFPIWSGAFDETNTQLKQQLFKSLVGSGLIQPGGVIASTIASGQQWDSPNAWAPHQSLIVHALLRLNIPDSLELAQKIGLRWIFATYTGYQKSAMMHEKYNGFIPGDPGSGGEYPPQIGFGWTNGVALEFLQMYGNNASLVFS